MLIITRKPGQFTLFSNGMRLKLLKAIATEAQFMLYDGDKTRKIIIPTGESAELSPDIRMEPLVNAKWKSNQLRIGFTAPRSIQILRDDAKCREKVA